MLHLIGESPIRFILALIIGLLTAWWIWGRLARAENGANTDRFEAEPAPEPRPEAAPVSRGRPDIAAAVGADDDLTKINGIGPKLCQLCNDLGVRRFDQIAAWDGSDVAKVDSYLGSFSGRIDRDEWVEQARLLAAGAVAEWESRFGYKSSPD